MSVVGDDTSTLHLATSEPELISEDVLQALRAKLGPRTSAAALIEAACAVAQETQDRAPVEPSRDLPLSPILSRRILDNLHEAILVARLDGSIVFFNDSAEEIFGCRREEALLGLRLTDLLPDCPLRLPPDHADECPATLPTDCRPAPVQDSCPSPADRLCRLAERRMGTGRRCDGAEFPVEISALGVGWQMVVTVTDISERRAAAERLSSQHAILQTLLDNIPGAVTLFGPDLKMMTCNNRLRDLLGFPDELFADGLPPLEALLRYNAERGEYGPGDIERIVADGLERARDPQPHCFERRRPDGTVLEIRGTPLPGGGFVTVYLDITDRKKAEEEAVRYATYLHSVLDNLPQGVSVFDEDFKLRLWNEAFIRVLDFPRELIREGVSFEALLRHNVARGEYGPVDGEEYVRSRLRQAFDFQPHRFERVRPNGQEVEVQGQPMELDGRVVGFVSTYGDITGIKEKEAALRRANDLVEDAINLSPTFVWEMAPRGRITFIKGSTKVLGYSHEEMLGRSFNDVRCRKSTCHDQHTALDRAILDREAFDHMVACAVHKEGRDVWLSVSAHPTFDADGEFAGYRGVSVDVTELARARRELERMALLDPLTGLANRRKFIDRFSLEIQRQERHGRPLTLLVLDLDHFKTVNDSFGHLTGDLCLKAVAELLDMSVRKIDLVGRFGGEEFVILLPDTGFDGGVAAAEKLRELVEGLLIPIDARFEPLSITVSAGVACKAAEDPADFDALMDLADKGLYLAKARGRNRVCVAEI